MRLVDIGAITSGAASEVYVKGYPFQGASEPNVKAQWVFDEGGTSPSLVDEVSGITLAPSDITGYTTAVSAGAAPYSGLTPGITCNQGAGTATWTKTTATAGLDIGASDDVVIEYWVKTTSAAAQDFFCIGTNGAGAHIGVEFDTATNWYFEWRTDDATLVNKTFTLPYDLHDGALHKIRMRFDRAGNATCIMDGTASAQTQSLAAISGKVTTNTRMNVGSWTGGGGNAANCTHFGLRISIGTDVLSNNSGGPNGG